MNTLRLPQPWPLGDHHPRAHSRRCGRPVSAHHGKEGRGKFSRDDLKAGTVLTVTGFPTADRTRLTARSISYPDGQTQTTSNEFFKPIDRTQRPIFAPA